MPSFSGVMGVITTFIVLSTASGHGDVVWKAIAEIRRVAITKSRQNFGCPSIFSKGACKSYDPKRYR